MILAKKLRAVIAAGLLLGAAMTAGGCAPPFSQASLDRVDRTVTFGELLKEPEQYRGTWVMLGGVIVGTRNATEGTFIEVLQKPIDRRGQPLDTDQSGGRFIISAAGFLDAAVYHGGRLITVIGEAAGAKTQPLGEIQYRYPVVSAGELHLWDPDAGPHFVFGVGVGIFHGR